MGGCSHSYWPGVGNRVVTKIGNRVQDPLFKTSALHLEFNLMKSSAHSQEVPKDEQNLSKPHTFQSAKRFANHQSHLIRALNTAAKILARF